MSINANPFSAIADPTRRQILDRLSDSGPMQAGLLAKQFSSISRPAVSKHLRVLRSAKLVKQEAKGREIWYSIEPLALQEVYVWMQKYERFWADRLLALKQVSEKSN